MYLLDSDVDGNKQMKPMYVHVVRSHSQVSTRSDGAPRFEGFIIPRVAPSKRGARVVLPVEVVGPTPSTGSAAAKGASMGTGGNAGSESAVSEAISAILAS